MRPELPSAKLRLRDAMKSVGTDIVVRRGRVQRLGGAMVVSSQMAAPIGEMVRVGHKGRRSEWSGQIVGSGPEGTHVAPLSGGLSGLCLGMGVTTLGHPVEAPVGASLLGRVLNGLGEPIDGKGPLGHTMRRSVSGVPPAPLERPRIDTPFRTGVGVLDGLTPLGVGQRIGIMAGSGVGKSVLLGMIARHSSADVNVIALLGERGREVREFLEQDLGAEGLLRSVVIVVTSDEPSAVRLNGALVATTIAEWYRDQGHHVALMMDSITRVCHARRDIGLALGEPPTTRGYPPSVFGLLPQILERAGTSKDGAITGLYTVLVDGDDQMEPIADAVRSILDGHIVLDRNLASQQIYPAINPLQSLSRVADAVEDPGIRTRARVLLRAEAAYEEAKDLLAMGEYREGTNPWVDGALAVRTGWLAWRRQPPQERRSEEDTHTSLDTLSREILARVAPAVES